MKKCLVVLGVIVFALAFVASDLMAYNSNLSVEYVRMPSRYASQDVDAAIYNPAGLARLAKDGLYFSLSNQFYIKEYAFEYDNVEYTADDPTYLFPNASVVYKQNNWAMFATLTVPDGGGTLTYEKIGVLGGLATLSEVKGESMWLCYTLGGSFALNEMVAFSSGIRWYTTSQKKDITLAPNTNYTQEIEADGMAAFIGFNITPMPGLNIGIQYQSKVRARGQSEVTDPGNLSGTAALAGIDIQSAGTEEYFEELPAFIQIGVGYIVMPQLSVQLSAQYVFQKEEKVNGVPVEFEDEENSYTIALGAEYAVMPGLKVSLGVIYSATAETEDSNSGLINGTNPGLNSYSIGLGASYVAIEGLTIDVGFIKPVYMEMEDAEKQARNKTVWGAALGVTYRAL